MPRRNVRKSMKSRKSRSAKPLVKKAIKSASNKVFAKKVLKVLHRTAENKSYNNYASNQTIITAVNNIPANINLCPPITQGTGQNNRIGNKVNIVKAFINGYVNLLPYNATNNPTVGPLYVKMWLFSVKDMKNSTTLSSTQIGTNFFEVGSSSAGFQGNVLDMCFQPNSQLVTVYSTKTVLLSSGATQGATYYNSAGASCGAEGRFSAPFYFDYTKHMKSLKYDDTTPIQPTNRNMWLAFQAVYADGTSSAVQAAEFHYNQKVIFEDL